MDKCKRHLSTFYEAMSVFNLLRFYSAFVVHMKFMIAVAIQLNTIFTRKNNLGDVPLQKNENWIG